MLPLYGLTKLGAPWVWSVDCEEAFDCLRNSLVENPITLSYPNWARPFIVGTDASATGVAGVLSQRDEAAGKLRPIDFFFVGTELQSTQLRGGPAGNVCVCENSEEMERLFTSSIALEIITDHNPLRWFTEGPPAHLLAVASRTGRDSLQDSISTGLSKPFTRQYQQST